MECWSKGLQVTSFMLQGKIRFALCAMRYAPRRSRMLRLLLTHSLI